MDESLIAWLPALLQTNDALFPTGAYAHSLGFEEYARMAGIKDETGLRGFVELRILPALRLQELPYVRYSFEQAHDLAALAEVDREISAWKLAKELREASMQVGGRRLAALKAMSSHERYGAYAALITSGAAPGHHLAICGLQAHVEGFPIAAALGAYTYQAVAGICSAALKLIRIGQEGCQRVLRSALIAAPQLIEDSFKVRREEAGYFDPLLEIAAMRHEFANERLFIS